MFNNDRCPITLDTLRERDPLTIFVHRDVAMDIDALYIYLTKSLYFTNPVNRVPFELEELVELERRMKERHGPNAIDDHMPVSPPSPQATDQLLDENEDVREGEVLSRLHVTMESPTQEDTIRLRVELDLPSPLALDRVMGDVPSSPGPSSPTARDADGKDEDKDKDKDDDDDADRLVFPLPSVVRMFLDSGRTRRLHDQLNLVQFLQYEAAEVIHEMIHVTDDVYWHQQVWEQTSTSVIDAVTQFVRQATAAQPEGEISEIIHLAPDEEAVEDDLRLEVHYTDCWEIYRIMVLHVLEKRYFFVCRDLARIDIEEFRVLHRAQVATVQRQAATQDVPYDMLLTILESVCHMVENGTP